MGSGSQKSNVQRRSMKKQCYRITTFDQVKVGRTFRYNKQWFTKQGIFVCWDESKKVHPFKMGMIVATELGNTYD